MWHGHTDWELNMFPLVPYERLGPGTEASVFLLKKIQHGRPWASGPDGAAGSRGLLHKSLCTCCRGSGQHPFTESSLTPQCSCSRQALPAPARRLRASCCGLRRKQRCR